MTLNLVLAPQPREANPFIFADASSRVVEPVLAALVTRLDAQRVIFPLPSETTRYHAPTPSLLRQGHADLWHALTPDERARTLLAAGPTAAYLAPVMGPASTFVAVPEPSEADSGAWQFVLGPFPDLDEIPHHPAEGEERDAWLRRMRTATSAFDLVRAGDTAAIAAEVAEAIGLGPKQAARVARAAASVDDDAKTPRRRAAEPHWIGEALYSASRAPRALAPRKRRRATS